MGRNASLESLARAARRRADPEHVHDLRVLTRRWRAPLWLLRRCQDTKRWRRASRELRALGQCLGERRQWDVAIEDAETFGLSAGKLGHEWRKADRRLRRALEDRSFRKLSKDVGRLTRELPRLSAKRLAAVLGTLEAGLGPVGTHLPRTTRGRHELRIRAKKVRYLIEAFGYRSPSLQRLQRHLGREHDLVFLQQALGRNRAVERAGRRERSKAEAVLSPAIRSARRLLRKIRTV